MRILQSGLNSKLNIEHSLQAQSDQGAILVVEASKLPNGRVSNQPLLVTRNELREMRATNLFFTFDHPFNIAGGPLLGENASTVKPVSRRNMLTSSAVSLSPRF